MSKGRAILSALVVGVLVTALSTILAWYLVRNGAANAAQIVYWPNTLLQAVFTPFNIGTAERPIYEGTPVQFVAFLLSFPLSVVAYSAAAYAWFMRRAQRGEA